MTDILEQLSLVADNSQKRTRNPATKAAREALVKAVLKKQLPELVSLLESGVDPNYVICKQGVEETPLGHALTIQWIEGAEALLDAGARDSDATLDGKPSPGGGNQGSALIALSLSADLALRVWDNETGEVLAKASKGLQLNPGSAAVEILVSKRSEEWTRQTCINRWFSGGSMVHNAPFFPKVADAFPGMIRHSAADIWLSAIRGNCMPVIRKLVALGIAPPKWSFEIAPQDFPSWSAPDIFAKKSESSISKWSSRGTDPKKISVMSADHSSGRSQRAMCPAILFSLVHGSIQAARYLAKSDVLLRESMEWERSATVASSLSTAQAFTAADDLGFDITHRDPTGRNILHRLLHNCDWNGNVAIASVSRLIERHHALGDDRDVNGLLPFDTRTISDETRSKIEAAFMMAKAKAAAGENAAKGQKAKAKKPASTSGSL